MNKCSLRIKLNGGQDTHCNVGTIPLTPTVAAAVSVVATVPGAGAGFVDAAFMPLGAFPSFSDGGVIVSVPPGNESDVGAVKARACAAVDGWELSESIDVCVYRPCAVVTVAEFTIVTEDAMLETLLRAATE